MTDALHTPAPTALPPPADTDPWATAGDSGAAVTPWDLPAAASDAPSTAATTDNADPWGAAPAGSNATDSTGSWLDAPEQAATTSLDSTDAASSGWHIQQLWDGSLPIESWINEGLGWVVQNFRPFFQTVRAPIDGTLTWVEGLLTGVPTLAMVAFGVIYILLSDPFGNSELGDRRTLADLSGPAPGASGAVDGKQLFAANCVACHQATGKGLPGVFPPLDGSEWVQGDERTLANILLYGVSGEMEVAGITYKGAMPAFQQLGDAELARQLSNQHIEYVCEVLAEEIGRAHV
mgnify:CR=1 FL=1